jgi:hypothetical protein
MIVFPDKPWTDGQEFNHLSDDGRDLIGTYIEADNTWSFRYVSPPVLGSEFLTPSITELNYVDGVTSPIQPQLDSKVDAGDNVNELVGNTVADAVPQLNGSDNYLFLVVDKSDGSIKAIDKTFLE